MGSTITQTPAETRGRQVELDWLRVIVVLGLIPYHAAVVFAEGPGDYVKSPQRSLIFDLAATVVSFAGMPLLFLVAGAATWFALARRSPGRYMLERGLRLAVPFLFGVLALVPIQLYVERLATPSYHLAYPQFYWTFLVGWVNIARQGVFGLGFQYWGHLWFILYLLAVSIFLLPALIWLRGPVARRYAGTLAAWSERPLVLFLLVSAPLAVIEAALQGPVGSRPYADYNSLYSGAAGLVLYAAAFVLGYIIYSDARFPRAIIRYRGHALWLALTLMAAHEIALVAWSAPITSSPWGALAIRVLRGCITGLLLIAILGYARRHLAMDRPALHYLNEASYPLYVLHMPALSALAFFIVRWPAPVALTFPALLVATACVTFAFYEGIVRRAPLARFLFGVKAPAPAVTKRRGVTQGVTQGVTGIRSGGGAAGAAAGLSGRAVRRSSSRPRPRRTSR